MYFEAAILRNGLLLSFFLAYLRHSWYDKKREEKQNAKFDNMRLFFMCRTAEGNLLPGQHVGCETGRGKGRHLRLIVCKIEIG